jgi:hypothetical protein
VGGDKMKIENFAIGMEQIEENEWIQPVEEGYELKINDGHVVEMDFRIYDGRVQFKIKSTGD